MAITAANIRALSGLSEAELPDKLVIDALVLDRVELDRAAAFITILEVATATTDADKIEAFRQHDYRCWKAIDYLASAIRTSIPQTLKDNFNQFTRFDSFEMMLGFAKSYTMQVEEGAIIVESLLSIYSPDIDPVTQG